MTLSRKDWDAAYDARVGARTRSRRELAGKRQVDAADAIGVTLGQMSRYETGEHPLTPSKLARLAKFYGCSVCDFFDKAR